MYKTKPSWKPTKTSSHTMVFSLLCFHVFISIGWIFWQIALYSNFQRVLLMFIFVSGSAGQICCSGSISSDKGVFPSFGTDNSCNSPDLANNWSKSVCLPPQTCMSYYCKITVVGVTWSAKVHQGCYDNATYQSAMIGSSGNGYSCQISGSPKRLVYLSMGATIASLAILITQIQWALQSFQ